MPPKITDVLNEFSTLRTELDERFQVLSDNLQKGFEEQFSILRTEFRQVIQEKNHEIAALKSEVNSLKSKVDKIETKFNESDNNLRQNNVVISGAELPNEQSNEDCVQVFRALCESKLRIIVPSTDICAAYRLGKQNPDPAQQNRRSLLVKFKSPDRKKSLMESCRAMKPGFYINDDIGPEKQTILYVLRKAKRKCPNIIGGYGSLDGRIIAWVKPQSPDQGTRDRKVMVNSVDKLRQLCSGTIGHNLETFISTWPH